MAALEKEAAAAATTSKPEGITLQRTEEGPTRWSFHDEPQAPSDETPINDDVSIKQRGEGVGVGLFARRTLAAGAAVLRRAPVAHAARGFDGPRCDACLSPVDKSMACRGGCGKVIYCGRACATSEAAADHVACGECAAAAALPKLLPTCLLASRVVRRARKDGAVLKYVRALRRKPEPYDDELRAAARVVQALSGDADENLCALVLAVLERNAHSVCDDELREVGVALYPRDVTAANHCCRPTVWPRFRFSPAKPPCLEYAVLRDVEKGSELTHEYADLLAPDRRDRLRRSYGFVCTCDECAFSTKAREAARDSLRAQRDALEVHLKAEDWDQAGEKAEAVARLEGFWSPGHPYTALHRLRCAKLQTLLGNARQAQVHVLLALVRLTISHGKESALAQEAAAMQARVIHEREGRILKADESSDDDFDWRKGMREW